MTYSLDFREKVSAIREQEGLILADVAVRFGISAGIMRCCKRLEAQRTRRKSATPIGSELNPKLSEDKKNAPLTRCLRRSFKSFFLLYL
jgi:hypothetical protein